MSADREREAQIARLNEAAAAAQLEFVSASVAAMHTSDFYFRVRTDLADLQANEAIAKALAAMNRWAAAEAALRAADSKEAA